MTEFLDISERIEQKVQENRAALRKIRERNSQFFSCRTQWQFRKKLESGMCFWCRGTGRVAGDPPVKCWMCQGTGIARLPQAPSGGPLCKCGCGERTKGGRFRPGHDSRYHQALKDMAARLLTGGQGCVKIKMKEGKGRMAAKLLNFGDGIKFVDSDGVTTAVLDGDGKLTIKDEAGGLTVWKYTDYIKDEMGDKPAEDRDGVIAQLGVIFGQSVAIDPSPKATRSKAQEAAPDKESQPKDEKENEVGKVTEMKKKTAKAAKPAKEKKEKVAKVPEHGIYTCASGSGIPLANPIKSVFGTGGDQKLKSVLKKVSAGDLELNAVPLEAIIRVDEINFLSMPKYKEYKSVMDKAVRAHKNGSVKFKMHKDAKRAAA